MSGPATQPRVADASRVIVIHGRKVVPAFLQFTKQGLQFRLARFVAGVHVVQQSGYEDYFA